MLDHYLPATQNKSEREMIFTDEFVVHIAEPSDGRVMKQDFTTAKKHEIEKLIKINIWNVCKYKDVKDNSTVMNGRLVATLKSYGPLMRKRRFDWLLRNTKIETNRSWYTTYQH